MSLRYALLGLLARESLTGYDLTKKFDSTIGFFWSAKHSQIYPELAALTKEGLVTFELVTQTSKPNKKVYTITDQGREALGAWVGDEGERRSVKDPLLMRVWSVGVVAPQELLPQLREARAEMDRRLAYIEKTETELKHLGIDAPSLANPALGPYLAMCCGRMQYVAYRDWLGETIATLETAIRAGAPG
jgi:DNA-binding PadR family transcriptional regulator